MQSCWKPITCGHRLGRRSENLALCQQVCESHCVAAQSPPHALVDGKKCLFNDRFHGCQTVAEHELPDKGQESHLND